MSVSVPETCCLHLTNVVDKIKPFSEITWTKVTNCIPKWIPLGSSEAEIASNLQNISVENELNIPNDSAIGFHQKCYNKFTDKTRIEAAEKRLIRQQKVPQANNLTNTSNLTLDAHQSKRDLQSTNIGIQSHSSHTILPSACIICRTEKYIKENHSGKRQREKLARLKTNDNLLLFAATSKNDEKILMELRCKDMAAIEVRYHRSCYKRYISKFTSRHTPVSGDNNHKESFKEFCSEVIEKRIMEQKVILEMNTLTELFVKKVFEKEGIDITGYRNSCLKLRIQKLYPNVHFIKRSKVNSCELVTC